MNDINITYIEVTFLKQTLWVQSAGHFLVQAPLVSMPLFCGSAISVQTPLMDLNRSDWCHLLYLYWQWWVTKASEVNYPLPNNWP